MGGGEGWEWRRVSPEFKHRVESGRGLTENVDEEEAAKRLRPNAVAETNPVIRREARDHVDCKDDGDRGYGLGGGVECGSVHLVIGLRGWGHWLR